MCRRKHHQSCSGELVKALAMAGFTCTPPSGLSSAAALQGSSPLHASSKLGGFSLGFDHIQERIKILAQKKTQKRYQILLNEDIPNLGKVGELLTVKPGYYRNYLFPFGKAKMATPDYLKELKLEIERKEAEKRKIKEAAESDAVMFRTIGVFSCRRKVGKGKQIFGQVTTQDLVDIIKAQTKKEIDKRDVMLPEIREVGEYVAEIKLHPEVTVSVRLNVIPS